MTAWTVSHRWNERYIGHYRRRAPAIARQSLEAGEPFTCEDFALHVLIRFASYYELPIRVGSAASPRGFDSRSPYGSSLRGYRRSVMSQTGARDIVRPGNTIGVGGARGSPANLAHAEPGDLIHLDYGGGSGHIQLVTGRSDDRITIIQGNLRNTSWALGGNNPESDDYYGEVLAEGYYELDGTFHRGGVARGNVFGERRGRVRRWDFTAWNQTPAFPEPTIRFQPNGRFRYGFGRGPII
jgi:hypothetical protein